MIGFFKLSTLRIVCSSITQQSSLNALRIAIVTKRLQTHPNCFIPQYSATNKDSDNGKFSDI